MLRLEYLVKEILKTSNLNILCFKNSMGNINVVKETTLTVEMKPLYFVLP